MINITIEAYIEYYDGLNYKQNNGTTTTTKINVSVLELHEYELDLFHLSDGE